MEKYKFSNPFKELNRFEWGLWAFSVISVILSFSLTKEKDIISLIASVFGVTALIFVAKGMVIGQLLCVFFSAFYGIISYKYAYYGEMITYLCMSTPIAMASVIAWLRHPFHDSRVVEVSKISKKCKIGLIILAPTVTLLFYFILKYLGTANLIVSTFSVTTSFIAAYLTYFRSSFYAIGYSINDIVLIVLWVLAACKDISSAPMILCFVAFLVNDLYGFYNWEKLKKQQKSVDFLRK